MAGVLIAWELGEAFGHLARCRLLAEGLIARGHEVTLVLKDARLPAGQSWAGGVTVLTAPLIRQAGAVSCSPVNYADMLRSCGFSSVPDVVTRLVAWTDILVRVRPDVLVADHSPTALLAARLSGLPSLTIGNGFAIPPDFAPWPTIRPWAASSEKSLAAAENRLDEIIEAAFRKLGHRHVVRMRELFGENDVLDTFPELDHYGERVDARYVGPIVSLPQGMPVLWQKQDARKVLAYIRPAVPGFRFILQALSRLDAEVLCVAPGISAELAKRCATQSLRIALVPVDLSLLLKHADLAVGYGNCGFSTQALLAGVPLAMRPRYVEQLLLARRVEMFGAGRVLDGQIDTERTEVFLREMLSDCGSRQAARLFQQRHHRFSNEQALQQSMSIIERAMSGCASHNSDA